MWHRRRTSALDALPFDRETVDAFEGNISVIQVPAGELLCRQGRYRGELIWILAGEADVIRSGRTIAHLTPGTVVGEINATHRKPFQTADVVTTTPALIGVQTLQEWSAVAKAAPAVAEYVARLAENRLAAQAA